MAQEPIISALQAAEPYLKAIRKNTSLNRPTKIKSNILKDNDPANGGVVAV